MTATIQKPPLPRLPYPGTLTDEEIDALPPIRLGDITKDMIERITGYKPMDMDLYTIAFTHKSADPDANYERLEFLGDSVINFTTAKFLFEKYPKEPEGFLTIMRTRLTCTVMLWEFSKKLFLDQYIMMNGRDMYIGAHKTKKIMEDVFEALVGAIYLDQGILKARQFILNIFDTYVDWDDIQKNRNYKDQLMRVQHQLKHPLPEYTSVRDDVEAIFTATARIPGLFGVGKGRTKREAEQRAARELLEKLGVPIDY